MGFCTDSDCNLLYRYGTRLWIRHLPGYRSECSACGYISALLPTLARSHLSKCEREALITSTLPHYTRYEYA